MKETFKVNPGDDFAYGGRTYVVPAGVHEIEIARFDHEFGTVWKTTFRDAEGIVVGH